MSWMAMRMPMSGHDCTPAKMAMAIQIMIGIGWYSCFCLFSNLKLFVLIGGEV